jgi:Flp pilus assembly protein TadD
MKAARGSFVAMARTNLRRAVVMISHPRLFVPVLIVLLTVAAFVPTLQNGFVNWDDQPNLLENPNYRGLGWAQLRWMFTTFHMGHYQPLTWVTFGLDYLLWEMNPLGYHVTSLILHAANAALFYFLALRLLSLSFSAVPRETPLLLASGFAALVFAIHPLRVESVAWATERRDVLSGLFFLATVLCYLKAVKVAETDSGRWRWTALAVILYLLSLLSKASGITLPIVLLVLDVYPLGRFGGGSGKWFGPEARRVWREKIPFLILAVAAGVVVLLAQHEAKALRSIASYGILPRIAQSLFGLTFYLSKTIVPLRLSPLYEMPTNLNPWDWPFVVSGIIVVAVSVCLFLARHRWPAGLASWVCYVVILLPVLGIAQSGPQLAADRYTYLSCLGWAILAGAGWVHLWRLWISGRLGLWTFMLAQGLAVAVLVGLGSLTWRQTRIWHDSERLWRHALAIIPSGLSHYYLGIDLAERGKLDEAIEQFRETLQINSSHVDTHYNLGKLLARRGDFEEAIQHFRRALEINPADAGLHNGLGLVLASQGNLEEALQHFRRALEIDPRDVRAHNNIAITLATRGDLEGAIQHFRRALEINPSDAGTYSNLANALLQRGDVDEAIQQLRHALELNPGDAGVHNNLAIILSRRGELEGAIEHFRRVLELNPGDAGVHNNLAITLARRGELEEASEHFREALRTDPEFAEAHAGLGRVLAMQGKKEEAVQHYQEALRILKSQRKTAAAR